MSEVPLYLEAQNVCVLTTQHCPRKAFRPAPLHSRAKGRGGGGRALGHLPHSLQHRKAAWLLPGPLRYRWSGGVCEWEGH